MIIMQPAPNDSTPQHETIPRVKRSEISKIAEDEMDCELPDLTLYKSASVPRFASSSLSEDMLQHQDISRRRAAEIDLAFFQDILHDETCREFCGYKTKICREQGHSIAPQTIIEYLPLID